ncbi:unnamed protein product [Rangifer tarandus platyrhynchus]|uniref:Uncharacterized protein n=1 Tax=Rangifer tarandus platyrhynchus TaxID=3082113 RepID=A0AC60A6B5_RANTA
MVSQTGYLNQHPEAAIQLGKRKDGQHLCEFQRSPTPSGIIKTTLCALSPPVCLHPPPGCPQSPLGTGQAPRGGDLVSLTPEALLGCTHTCVQTWSQLLSFATTACSLGFTPSSEKGPLVWMVASVPRPPCSLNLSGAAGRGPRHPDQGRETRPALPMQLACFLNIRGPAQTERLQHQQPAGFADEKGSSLLHLVHWASLPALPCPPAHRPASHRHIPEQEDPGIARLCLLCRMRKRGGIRADLRVTVKTTLPPSEAERGLGLRWILWAGARVPGGAGGWRAWS